jgi:hypothetical protein
MAAVQFGAKAGSVSVRDHCIPKSLRPDGHIGPRLFVGDGTPQLQERPGTVPPQGAAARGVTPGIVAGSCCIGVSADRISAPVRPFFLCTPLAIVMIACSIGSRIRLQQRDNRAYVHIIRRRRNEPTFFFGCLGRLACGTAHRARGAIGAADGTAGQPDVD